MPMRHHWKGFLTGLLEEEPEADRMAILRRLFFEAHTMTMTDARQRVEAQPDPAMATMRMATAERIARQREQQGRLGGLMFTPETIPANNLVDLFIEMCESGILSYVKPEQCCSRAQEVHSIKKDPTVSTDSAGMLKLGAKVAEPTGEANTELKLRSAGQRRDLAMDLAGLASFETMEGWTQLLFSHLLREQPRGLAKVPLQQLLDCDKQMFMMASHRTMGNLRESADKSRPLDATVESLQCNTEILQYLIPLPVSRAHETSVASGGRPEKVQRTDKGKGTTKGAGKTSGAQNIRVPDGCTSHDDDNKPLCFAFCLENASSRGLPVRGVRGVSINVTRKDATAQNHIIFALTLTDTGRMRLQFHKVQFGRQMFQPPFHMVCRMRQWFRMAHLPCLWNSYQKKRPSQIQPCKQGCEW